MLPGAALSQLGHLMDSAVTLKLGHTRVLSITALAVAVALAWTYLLLGAQMDVQKMDMGDGQTMAMPGQ